MRRFFEIACIFMLATSVAKAGGIGGGTGGFTVTVTYDSVQHVIIVPGRLGERFDISPRGSNPDSGYCMEDSEFAKLQSTADTYKSVEAKGETGGTRSYRVTSGDQSQQVELIDRRAAARNGVAQ